MIHHVLRVLAVDLVLVVVGEEDVGDHGGAADSDDPEKHDVGLAVTEEVVLAPLPRIILIIKGLEVNIILEILLILVCVSVLNLAMNTRSFDLLRLINLKSLVNCADVFNFV